MARNFLDALALASATAPLAAAPLNVRVIDPSGRPIRDAVVTVYPAGVSVRPARKVGRVAVAQQNLQFRPFLTIIPVGTDVSFPNLDPTKHHVYSFSPAKKFELKLFAKDESRTVHFEKAGIVALGCNIHDQMSAFIVVTDSAWTERTDARGIAAFDVPTAPARIVVWHPYLRAPGGKLEQSIAATQRNLNVQVKLRPPPAQMSMDY